jgi:uncharacterized protein
MDFNCLEVEKLVGFEWDEGNIDKNLNKHGLPHSFIEEIFFNEPLLIVEDFRHSKDECRCFALGRTFEDKYLFVAFTVRGEKIRVISARAMNKKERSIYENKSI